MRPAPDKQTEEQCPLGQQGFTLPNDRRFTNIFMKIVNDRASMQLEAGFLGRPKPANPFAKMNTSPQNMPQANTSSLHVTAFNDSHCRRRIKAFLCNSFGLL